jgi:anthranilate synthase component 2
MILIIDNDSGLSYSLYQMVGCFRSDVVVLSGSQITGQKTASDAVTATIPAHYHSETLLAAEALAPTHIIISSGSGRPENATFATLATSATFASEVVERFAGKTPILGICLGHLVICQVFGAKTTQAKTLMHARQSQVHIANGNPIFRGLPPLTTAGRYHSLAVDRDTLPEELLVIAEADDGEVMGIKHRDHDIFVLQFRPESVLTPNGAMIIENFIQIGGDKQ